MSVFFMCGLKKMFKRIVLIIFFLLTVQFSSVNARAEFSFKGVADFKNRNAELIFYRRENESATLNVEQKSDNHYFSILDIKNLDTRFFDIATIIENTVEVKKTAEGLVDAIAGELVSRYTLINHAPVQEFQGYFDYTNGYLTLSHLSIGNVICSGRLKFRAPVSINLRLTFSDVNLTDAIYFFTLDETIESSGFVEGVINISGDLPHIQVNGNFKSEYGAIGKLVYKRIEFDFQGPYPLLQIVDSSIIREDGHIFKVSGALDISERGDYKEQFTQLKMEPVVHQDGDNLEWTFKRIESEGTTGSTEIKYEIRKEDDVNTLSEENSDLLGIERKVQF